MMAAAGFAAPTMLGRSSALIRMKATPEERPEERPEVNINKNSIVEFHEKHGSGAAPPILGLVTGAEYKAKGGARIQIVDSTGSVHSVKENTIHVDLGAYKGKLVEPAAILKEYETVMQLDASELGVEADDLELAWQLCAESDAAQFTPKAIISLVDESMYKSSRDKYRAFRLLTSSLGKVFFKAVNANEYKVKAEKSVSASKEHYCREQTELEWCFV
jgi:hypothetical protein